MRFHLLPFLKHKKEASASASMPVQKREHDEDYEYDGLESAMEELGGHLASKSWKEAADCFRHAMQIADQEPSSEGENF